MNIFVIDTNKFLCTILSDVLEEAGHAVTFMHAGKEVVDAAAKLFPDLILLDIDIPDESGLGIIRRLERLNETRNIPVIVVSAEHELEDELLNVFDFIPKPVDIRRLREDITIVAGGAKRKPDKGIGLADRDFRLFANYLLTHTGLHFESRNAKLLERGLLSRMSALRTDSFRDYYEYLARHGERRQELGKLLQFLTVGETYFFRYHAHFDAMQQFILPRLVEERKRQGDKRIRLWSAGCSTGEEPYSLAMTIMELLPDWREWDIKIMATDINNRSLRRAREGVYRGRALRVMDKGRLDRYFRAEGSSYIVRNNVKNLVEFSHFNLQSSEFPVCNDDSPCFDLIFCRNVMIYFNLPTTREIVAKFAKCLHPGGYLFLGHSETLLQISDEFDRETECGGFYYRKRGAGAPRPDRQQEQIVRPVPKRRPEKSAILDKARLDVEPRPYLLPLPNPRTVADEVPEMLFRKATELFDAEDYAAASAILQKLAIKAPEHAEAMVMDGFILANEGNFADALNVCGKALAINDLQPEAYFLRGLVLELSEMQADAVNEYRKAILLNMGFVMPHYQLGKLLFRQGKQKEGGRELRNCLRILEKSGEGSIIPYSGGLSREVFLELIRGELSGPLKH